ncbi:Transcription elongation factor A protein 2 [Portunus trituberculatus]|uniref:Transcription elongation factor A protein 2 n=1 Tax=Portunus trituberculatus TaxID=210409 RepID=A0A5B7G4Q4_PORTR|nr:Transcription elongation factor A protein 2 [Portunus trituberculatus]
MKIRNLVRVQVLVSYSSPLVNSQESQQKKSYNNVFVDGDSSSGYLPLSPHPSPLFFLSYLSPAFTYEFGKPEAAYKNRLRSRIYNLKDSKNPQLRENVLRGAITPQKMAVMTSEASLVVTHHTARLTLEYNLVGIQHAIRDN